MKSKKLLEPGKIGTMEVKNRMILAAMVTNFAGHFGEVTDHHIEYYARIAKGGVGLIIVEASYVMPDYGDQESSGMYTAAPIGAWKNSLIPGLARLAQTIKDNGAKAILQFVHGGRQVRNVKHPVAPSPVFEELTGNSPRELTIDEIEEMEEAFAEAVLRAKNAGFDGVEFSASHGYIPAQFFSGATNKRMDKYGGCLENRMRFGLNIIKRTREKVGRDFPIIWRNSAMEALPGGIIFDEVKIFAKKLEKAGVDALHLTAGGYGIENAIYSYPPNSSPLGVLVPYAEEMKREKVVEIPIITVGKISDPFLAEEIVEKGKADFVAMGRALLADPDFPRKLIEERPEDIRRCTHCGLCLQEILNDRCIRCTVNPLIGREGQGLEEIGKAEKRKKVMVIGAGPAGMEVARVCALRGHEVTLYEKTKELGGGQLKLATVPPYKESLKAFRDYLSVQIEKLGIKKELGVEVTASLIEEVKPDVVVIATGGEALVPKIPGVDRKNVVTAHGVLSGEANVGDKVIMIGGGSVGCETAEYLAKKGKEVTIIEMIDEIGMDMGFVNRNAMLLRFAEENVRIETEITCKEVTDEGIVATDKWGREIRIETDTVVFAAGVKPLNSLKNELVGKAPEVYVIGDAKEPRKIWHAISEGFLLGRRI